MPRTRPPYPEEFRREAIKLALLGDKPQRKLAKDLGISDVTLRNWLKQERAERGERPDGLSGDEREELARLRDENATLRMEREILSKAAVLLAWARAFRRVQGSGSRGAVATGIYHGLVGSSGFAFSRQTAGGHHLGAALASKWLELMRADARRRTKLDRAAAARTGEAIAGPGRLGRWRLERVRRPAAPACCIDLRDLDAAPIHRQVRQLVGQLILVPQVVLDLHVVERTRPCA